MRGSRGLPLALSWGFKGVILYGREWPLWSCRRQAANVAPLSSGKCRTALRRQISLDRQSPAAGDLDVLLRQRQAQYAVVVAGLDALGLDAGDIEAPRVAAVAALAADVALVLLLVLVPALGLDGQVVAVDVDGDVLLLHAGQIGLEQVMVALVLNVGLERADVAEEVAVAEERALQRLHVTERVIGGHVVIVAVRSQFKHNEYLRKFEIWKASGACLPLLFLTQSLPRNCVQRYAFV